jgi:glutathione synthase/RimK-type ligase-like ATP-grasp enzyme
MFGARGGLCCSKTLVSNEPERIRQFIRANANEGTIFKTFGAPFWALSNGGSAANYVVKITEEEALPSDAMLRTVPGIYQALVRKAHELRVNYFGGHMVAAKINSQDLEAASLDWRTVDSHALKIELCTLPSQVQDKCRHIMQRLGLVFGCFDLIVTPQGDYVFLEVNEMGQFLWIEEVNPEIALLDTFVDFLVQGKAKFVPPSKPSSSRLSFQEISSRAEFTQLNDFDVSNYESANIFLHPDSEEGKGEESKKLSVKAEESFTLTG